MRHSFVVSGNKISRTGSLGLMIGGVFLMASVLSGIAQVPQLLDPGSWAAAGSAADSASRWSPS